MACVSTGAGHADGGRSGERMWGLSKNATDLLLPTPTATHGPVAAQNGYSRPYGQQVGMWLSPSASQHCTWSSCPCLCPHLLHPPGVSFLQGPSAPAPLSTQPITQVAVHGTQRRQPGQHPHVNHHRPAASFSTRAFNFSALSQTLGLVWLARIYRLS